MLQVRTLIIMLIKQKLQKKQISLLSQYFMFHFRIEIGCIIQAFYFFLFTNINPIILIAHGTDQYLFAFLHNRLYNFLTNIGLLAPQMHGIHFGKFQMKKYKFFWCRNSWIMFFRTKRITFWNCFIKSINTFSSVGPGGLLISIV